MHKELYLIEYLKVPVQVIPHLTEEILLSSFYNDIKENFKLKIVGANRKIRADLPNNLEVEYLKCTPITPMLEVQQVTYLNNGLLLKYVRSRHTYGKRSVLVHSLYNVD